MEKKYFNEIITFMSKTIATYGFTPVKDEEYTFKGETKAFRVTYDDNKQFCLQVADVNEGEIGIYSNKAAWLFDENHSAKDTLVIAEDFEEALLKELGVQRPLARAGGEVALPSKTAVGQAPNIEGLTQKLLSIFPEFKETYKEELAKNGEYLYVDFMSKTFVPKLRQVMAGGNKKQIAKIMDMLGKMYYEGDSTVSNVVVGVLIAGTFKDDIESFTRCAASLDNYPYLKTAGMQILQSMKKNKKYAALFA